MKRDILIYTKIFSNYDYLKGKKNEATTYFSTATDRSIIGTDMFHF